MRIEFLEAAQTELDQAFEWYESQQKGLGTDKIIVVAVTHLHRKPDYWLDRS